MEHKILDDYKVKANVMTGTTSLLTAELTKTLKSNVDVIIGLLSYFSATLGSSRQVTYTTRLA